jgi:hypothetical protein
MEIKVYVLPGGKLQIMVDGDGVSFEDAQRATLAVLDQLRAQGLAVDQTSAIEQHREGGIDHVHLTQHQEARHDH